MTFLKKLGLALAKGLAYVTAFAPVIEQVVPGSDKPIAVISADLTQMANVVASVEAAGVAISATGAQKLQMAIPAVAQVVLQSSVLVGKKIENADLFNKAASEYAQATVDLLNSLKADVVTVDKTA